MAWKKTPQGYAVTTATITRAGSIEYYGHEIGLTGSDANKKISILRTLEELSRPETLKSFEGLPLTLTHPDSGAVTAGDHKEKAIGHIQNVRVEGDKVICDVYITDAAAIATLEKTDVREVSVGYEPAEIEERDGKLYHINIRGNHVAVVTEGRYGAEVRLNDRKGKTMFKTLTDALAFLRGKKLKDSEGAALTADEIVGMIAALEKALADLDGNASEEALAKSQELIAQLAELKTQLESMKAVQTDADPGNPDGAAGDDLAALKEQNAQLQAKVSELETENSSLKEEIEKLKGEKSTEATMTDAKARFPKVNLKDAKSERDIHAAVLVQRKVFTDAAVKGMSDEALRSAYIAVQVATKPRSEIGQHLLSDSAPGEPHNYTKQFGGK
ncbi:DUF2213 domain-containing protein [Morganella sp. B601]|uniref:DUF2213 domain-containing protein n=1 Tax=Morganella sp. B601 TaxID=3444315 RepID=UPI003EBE12CF